MDDESWLDAKYFVDNKTYNCPFCNRRNVTYHNLGYDKFDWSNRKECYIWRIECSSCDKISIHLTYKDLCEDGYTRTLRSDIDIDSNIFYSVPTSFFVVDRRIPAAVRELITEAEGCMKMNFLTGASACTRKAIYELLIKEKAQGAKYEDQIKSLKAKHPELNPELIDTLAHIQDMTSDKVHEQSWPKWDAQNLKLFLETLKVILHEIYVVPGERKARIDLVKSLKEEHVKAKKDKKKETKTI